MNHLFNQKVIIYNRTGYNKEGTSVYDDGNCVKCRVEVNRDKAISLDGNDASPGLRLFVPSNVPIGPDDKIQYNGMEMFARYVETMVDGAGNIRYRLVLV